MSKIVARNEASEAAKVFRVLSLLDDSDEEDLDQVEREEREEQEELALINYALVARNRYIDRPIKNQKRDNYIFDKKWDQYRNRRRLYKQSGGGIGIHRARLD
ncbi:hypothetical protein EC957_000513 [Mortierella hygrophila]|uniref:Uncharacterized protein n=1 Tax=Mortierella hygrophila TaxID=979708 RepID=A0A9P6K303_9FUNG|nr:hypothetical protein EC957_000513 [Mortierella hygrophila]